MLLHKARLITFPLPRWLRNGAVQILLIVALLWAFFYLTGDILVEGLDNMSKTDPNASADGTGAANVTPAVDPGVTSTKDASNTPEKKEEAPKKVVVPQFQGSPTDGYSTANTASQQSNSNSAQAIENSKNDHYVNEPSPKAVV